METTWSILVRYCVLSMFWLEVELKMPVVGLEASGTRYFCANFPDRVSIGVLMMLPGYGVPVAGL